MSVASASHPELPRNILKAHSMPCSLPIEIAYVENPLQTPAVNSPEATTCALQVPGKEAELFDETRPWWYRIPVVADEVDEIGEMFGTGKMVAEEGQRMRVDVVVEMRAGGIIVAAFRLVQTEQEQLR